MAPRAGLGSGLASESPAKQDLGPGLFCQVCENRSRAWEQSPLARPGVGRRALFREEWTGSGRGLRARGAGRDQVRCQALLDSRPSPAPPRPGPRPGRMAADLSRGRRGAAEPQDPGMPVSCRTLGPRGLGSYQVQKALAWNQRIRLDC